MKCNECNQEFTEQDKANANWHEFMGVTTHRMCPGTVCNLCDEEIENYTDAKRGAGGQGWQHKSCKPVAISSESRKARNARLRDEAEEERGYNASSWIVRK